MTRENEEPAGGLKPETASRWFAAQPTSERTCRCEEDSIDTSKRARRPACVVVEALGVGALNKTNVGGRETGTLMMRGKKRVGEGHGPGGPTPMRDGLSMRVCCQNNPNEPSTQEGLVCVCTFCCYGLSKRFFRASPARPLIPPNTHARADTTRFVSWLVFFNISVRSCGRRTYLATAVAATAASTVSLMYPNPPLKPRPRHLDLALQWRRLLGGADV